MIRWWLVGLALWLFTGTAHAAFPVVAATANSTETADVTTHTVNLPASIGAGDLLVAFACVDASPTITEPSGWSVLHSTANGSANTGAIWYKVASGSEGATMTFATSAGQQSAHITWRVTGHGHSASAPNSGTAATGTDANPNPPSLTPAAGAQDYLWVVTECNDNGQETVTAYPADYTSNQLNINNGNVAGAAQAVASRNLNTTTQDPGTFTITTATEQWVTQTLAIAPAPPADPATTPGQFLMGMMK